MRICHERDKDRQTVRPRRRSRGPPSVHRDVAAEPASLVLEGDLGAGKTALWRAAVAAARERGHRVLVSRATEGEASLAFAALGDLLRDVLDEGLSTLPPPQAAALRVAVLLQEPDGPPPDPLAVAVATLGLVRELAADRPVLIALDDYAWLDAASENVLAFVLRRLETELSACSEPSVVRTPAPADPRCSMRRRPAGLCTGCWSARSRREAIDALLVREVPTPIPPPRVSEIADMSGGNPLFAIEIGRSIERGEIVHQPGRPLNVPATLRDLVAHRLSRLKPPVQEALFVAAAVRTRPSGCSTRSSRRVT